MCVSVDPLLGGADLSDGAGPGFPVAFLSVNVTALNRERLETVLRHAAAVGAHFICLQETRHGFAFAWASTIALQAGWRCAWSPSPPLSQHGAPKPGGCALLWRDFGRSTPVSCSLPAEHAHRVVGRTFADFTLVCVYLPARENSPHLVHTVFQAAEAEGKPWLVVGDYTWRASYDHVRLGFEASTFPHAVTTVGHQGAPTRACCSANVSVSNAVVQTCPLPGIPHHQAVVFADAVVPNLCDPAPSLRARRTAVYEWSLPPAPQLPALCQRLISAVPPLCPADLPFDQRLSAWHVRAEKVCSLACQLGVARTLRKGERGKGSALSMRPRAPPAVHRATEPVPLRRWRRLHRSASE